MPSVAFERAKQTKPGECGPSVLPVEPKPIDATGILAELRSVTNEPLRIEWAIDLCSGIRRLCTGGVVAVVLDLVLSDSRGVETFDKLYQTVPRVPILILSEADAEEMAREAVQRGAQDYVIKNRGDAYRLNRAVRTMMDQHAQETKSLENEAANVTLDSIGEAVLRTDLHGNVIYLNRVAEEMTGWRQQEARGLPLAEVFRLIDGGSGLAAANVDSAAAQKGAVQKDKSPLAMADFSNCILVRRDGFECGIQTKVTLIRDQEGKVAGAVLSFNDVSAARATSRQHLHSAEHDALTDLPNRLLFSDRLAQAISLAERQHKRLAVMFIDLDHFKNINDSLGHAVGDKLLQSIAGRLTTSVRRSDTVSRLGGDELVILLSQVEHAEDAAFSARELLRSLAVPHVIDGRSLDISVSIGVSTYPGDGQCAEDLMNRADNAMYEAKQHGRNNYQFFRSDMGARLAERRSLEADLRCALGRNELVLHYQPKLNLRTGKITGVEALVRWQHPERGLINPALFIPIAEDCGLILSIGRWVLLEACRQARAWSDSGLGVVPVAVNVSAVEFGAKDFLSAVRSVLIATGVEPRNLELELTETGLMGDAG